MYLLFKFLHWLTELTIEYMAKIITNDLQMLLNKHFYQIKVICRDTSNFNIMFDIVSQQERSFEEELKIVELFGEIENKYNVLYLECILWTRKEYNESKGI